MHNLIRSRALACLLLVGASCDSAAGERTQYAPDSGDSKSDSVSDAGAPATCDPAIGLARPLPMCSPQFPCTRVAPELPQTPITSPSDPIACADPRWTARLEWTIDGVKRQACLFRPPGASPTSPRSLVVWFHPGAVGGDVAEEETHFLDMASGLGFLLAVVQGRNLHFPTLEPRDGRHHDFYHRDLRSPSSNPDIASADHLIDEVVAAGGVDPRRIHVMGWSNGGFFGELYAIARHDTPTPGGSRVAAAAVFAAGDPFDDIQRDPFTGQETDGSSSCRLDALPASSVPILLVHRTCDRAVPCGSSDLACFGAEPGFNTSQWIDDARAGGLTGLVGHVIGGLERGPQADLDVDGCTTISTCDPSPCSEDPSSDGCMCLINHLRWPDGDYGGGEGVDREPLMLTFLRDHPLP